MKKSAPHLDDFRQIHDAYAVALRKFLFRMGIRDELDDLVQETFIKVFTRYESFKGTSSQKTWIFSVALNTARDHLREKKRKNWLQFFTGSEESEPSRGNLAKDYADKVEIERLLGALSPKLREVVVLSCQEELELQEIATILDIPLGTVKSRPHQARSKLESLDREEADHVTA